MKGISKLLAAGWLGGGQTLQQQLEAFGTLAALWLPENATVTDSRTDSIVDPVNAKTITQGTVANKPRLVQLSNGTYLLQYVDTSDDLGIAGTPFSTITNGTLIVTLKTSVSHIPFGDNTVTSRRGYIASSGSGTADGAGAGMGTITWSKNDVDQIMTTRDNAFTVTAVNDWIVMCGRGVNLSNFVSFNVGQYSSSGGVRFVGYIDAIALYSDNLSAANRTGAISALTTRINAKKNLIPSYTETSYTVTPDAANEACTGIFYDAVHDEIVMSKWGSLAGSNRIQYRSPVDLSLIDETPSITADASSIQSVVYVSELDAYLVSGTKLFQRDGTFIRSYTIPVGTLSDSGATYYNGHFYYINGSNKAQIIKCTIDASSLTNVETITLNRYTSNDSSGLAVTSSGYWFWGTGSTIEKYSLTGVFMETITSTGANTNGTEGITVSTNGTVYVCRDDYFHSATANGNKIWKYVPN